MEIIDSLSNDWVENVQALLDICTVDVECLCLFSHKRTGGF